MNFSLPLFNNENIKLIQNSKNLIEEHLNLFKNHQININKTLKYFSILIEFHLNSLEFEKEKNLKKKEKLNLKLQKQKEYLEEKEEIDFGLLNNLKNLFYVNEESSMFAIEPELSLKSDSLGLINNKLQNFIQNYEKVTNLKNFDTSSELEKKIEEKKFEKEDFDFFILRDPYVDFEYKLELIKEILETLQVPFQVTDFIKQEKIFSKDEKDFLIDFNSFEAEILKNHPNLQ